MKLPGEIRKKWARQWERADLREVRLLDGEKGWPIALSLSRPSASAISADVSGFKNHLTAWRSVSVGRVSWQAVSYRAMDEPVEVPIRWELFSAREWVAAIGKSEVSEEFEALERLLAATDLLFHPLFIRRRLLWRGASVDEVIKAARVAMVLEPKAADGLPLRALSVAGVDTKFFERNERLLLALLDSRFDGEASAQGLAGFLGAYEEGDHWVLMVDLDGDLLPFEQLRVRSSELFRRPTPGKRLLIVENERCFHQLPPLPNTVAILGAGFDLAWTRAEWLLEKNVAYWGDLDTWGLELLGRVREARSELRALLMTEEVFEEYRGRAVSEPTHAGLIPHSSLTPPEQALYRRLLSEKQGRLEQEFLPFDLVREVLLAWEDA